MINQTVRNLIEKYGYTDTDFYLITDDGFGKIADAVTRVHTSVNVRRMSDYGKERMPELLNSVTGGRALLLAEPRSFVSYGLYPLFDFSRGEPAISHCDSHVLIFPVDSFLRIFETDPGEDRVRVAKVRSRMKDNRAYRVTTKEGTDLRFTSRNWIPLDFEVCTAPSEDLTEGRIVVDGAVFFRKCDMVSGEKIVLDISCGKVAHVSAFDGNGQKLAQEYRDMIAGVAGNPVNLRLAEVRIGCCRGDVISDCFMEAETVTDTCHFCFGNNICYGGTNASDFHGNSVLIRNPKFEEIS